MLKIEVVKFEAQDVITASVAAAPEKICACTYFGGCTVDEYGNHLITSEDAYCGDDVHYCGK